MGFRGERKIPAAREEKKGGGDNGINGEEREEQRERGTARSAQCVAGYVGFSSAGVPFPWPFLKHRQDVGSTGRGPQDTQDNSICLCKYPQTQKQFTNTNTRPLASRPSLFTTTTKIENRKSWLVRVVIHSREWLFSIGAKLEIEPQPGQIRESN